MTAVVLASADHDLRVLANRFGGGLSAFYNAPPPPPTT